MMCHFLSSVRRKFKLRLVLYVLVLLTLLPAYGQQNLDSLEKNLSLVTIDSVKYKQLTDLAWGYSRTDPKRALVFAEQARKLAETTKNEFRIAHVNYYFGVINKNMGNFDQALKDLEPYTAYFLKVNNKRNVCFVYYQTGIIKSLKGDFKGALVDFYKNIDLAKELGLKETEANTLSAVATIHRNLKDYKKAQQLLDESLEVYSALNDSLGIIKCKANSANIYSETGEYAAAEKKYLEAFTIAAPLKDQYSLGHLYYNQGKLYLLTKENEKAGASLLQARVIREKLGHKQDLANTYDGLGNYYLAIKNYPEATTFFDKAFRLAEEVKALEQMKNAAEGLAKAYQQQKNYPESNRYFDTWKKLSDSLLNKEITRQLNELNVQYESAEKQKLIDEQQIAIIKKNNQKQLLVTGLIALVLISLVTFFFLRKRINYQRTIAEQKEKINQQQISELQQQNKLLAMNSMLEGQEAERLRIAKDLHDGLGGLLSTVKAHFSKIQSEIEKIEGLNIYHKANHLIDEACIEVRRIAHNMMPHSLAVTGLKGAMEDLGSNLKAQGLVCTLDIREVPETISENRQIMIYRIIQELAHNVVKHAQATDIFIQLYNADNSLRITVEDNGKGFDPDNSRLKEGLGLKSIDSRVSYLNGVIQYDSVPGKGTTINLEIPLHD